MPHAPLGADVVHVVSDAKAEADNCDVSLDPNEDAPPDFMTLDEWPISVCVAWIAWRDPVRVSLAYSEWRKWRGLPPARSLADLQWNCEIGLLNVSSIPEPIPEAAQLGAQLGEAWERQLRTALSDGKIRATGVRLTDRRKANIKPKKWIGLDSLDGSEAFGTQVDEDDENDGFCAVPRYRRVRIKKDAILAIWPRFDNVVPSTDEVLEEPVASDDEVQDAVSAPSSQILLTKDEIEQAYIARAKNWPEGRPSPNEVDDRIFLKSLSPSLSRKRAREIRSAFAPDEWRRSGRRRRN